MAKKRKSRAPAPRQPAEPESEPELVPEKVQEEGEPEPEPSLTVEALEEDPRVEGQEVEDEENSMEEVEEEEVDNYGIAENTEGKNEDVVSTEPVLGAQDSQSKVKPSYDGETSGQNEEGENELEEEPLEKLLEPFSKDQLTVLIKEAVARHPDIMENVHQFADADPAHCKIFVYGLGWEANAETITSVFGKYGLIEDCKVVKDKNSGKSKGYGFILFKHRDGARRALKQPQKMIEGRMTSCQLASVGPVPSTPPAPVVANVASPSVSEFTQRKIYVSNVSAEVDPKKLFDFFSRFGEIEEGPLGLDKMTGKPRGFSLFVYKTPESAKKALEEPHKHFDGQILHCQKAVDGPKHNRGYFNQQHGQPQHHHQGNQGFYHPAKKGRYGGNSGAGHTSGHLMAPSAGAGVPTMGFNPAIAPAALGQAVAALLATQGAGLGIGNLLGGMGAGVNPQGVPPMMNNAVYGGQPGMQGGYGGQPGMQGSYAGQSQMGPGTVRPHQGGAPYMGHGN